MTIIGEIGINHNGNLNYALDLIKIAKDCGVDVVKFQKRNPDKCVPENQKNKLRTFSGKEMTYLEYKKLIEFDKKDYDKINDYCKQIGIQWTVSVWDTDSVNFISQYIKDIPFIKIPSACITNLDIINKVNELNIPVIISNGMSTQNEVDFAVSHIKNLKGIMHCNSTYPCREDELDLNVIDEYRKKYKNLLIGYSGHELGIFPSLVAVSKNIDLLERHITLSNDLEGTDQKSSLNPEDLKQLVNNVHRIMKIQGNSFLTCYPSENSIKEKLRK